MEKRPRSGPELLEYLYSGKVVKEMAVGSTQVRFFDTCYRDASPEELEKRRARINAAALNCIMSWGKDEKKDEQSRKQHTENFFQKGRTGIDRSYTGNRKG